ncbi:hypothetical protein MRX96_044872 [Rhipicephalus microplus]
MRRLVVYPLPKNMGPGESEGRRAARARALLLQHQNDEGAVYVDVAKVKNKDAYVAAAVAATTGKIVTSCSVRTRSASQAEEMAIALAARSPGVRTILSDSKTAIRSFSRGAVCGAAARALASDESKDGLERYFKIAFLNGQGVCRAAQCLYPLEASDHATAPEGC